MKRDKDLSNFSISCHSIKRRLHGTAGQIVRFRFRASICSNWLKSVRPERYVDHRQTYHLRRIHQSYVDQDGNLITPRTECVLNVLYTSTSE